MNHPIYSKFASPHQVISVLEDTPIKREFLSPNESEIEQLQKESELIPFPNDPLFFQYSAYHRQGMRGTHHQLYFRKSLLSRLLRWRPILDKMGASFIVYDAFRTLECQMDLFDHFMKEIQSQNPNWEKDRVEVEAAQFVAHPKYRPSYSALPHNTGAAIDLSLGNRGEEEAWDFGTGFDSPTEMASTDFFERDFDPSLKMEPNRWKKIQRNRRVLFNLMKFSGFANYSKEWWHYNLGDSSWATQVGAGGPIFDSAEGQFQNLIHRHR